MRDTTFERLTGANPATERIATGFRFTEGPVFSRLGYLLFSDSPSGRILKWEAGKVTVSREKSNGAGGLTFDHQGRLPACEQGRITRTEKNGAVTVLADRCETVPLNHPNDVVYAIDGTITSPTGTTRFGALPHRPQGQRPHRFPHGPWGCAGPEPTKAVCGGHCER
jgi:gluconolactonase